MMRPNSVALLILLIATCVLAQNSGTANGVVRGELFTLDANGSRAIVPSAKISLDGAVHIEATSDSEGRFTLDAVPPGSYAITAQAPGMTAQQSLTVTAGSVSEMTLEMKIQAVVQSATVRANSDSPDAREASGINTIHESAIRNMPNVDERWQTLLPLVPGVVRGLNGLINMKGARASQNGSLINNADVTDPATGASTINIPIDVVSSVQVFSTPYDPEYGKFTGAVANVETRIGDFNRFRMSFQNFLPRLRRVDGSIMGIAEATPRVTVSFPIVKDRVALTQSFEYRYERDLVDSLPPQQAWTRSESFNSYTQLDFNISQKQTATASFAVFPQKSDYDGLNTFTPQASTPNLHERGFQGYLQDRYVTNAGDLLTSQVSFTRFDTDVLPNSDSPYELLVETTEGGFFDRQKRDTTRTEWDEVFRSHPYRFLGTHEVSGGIDFAHSSYEGWQTFLAVQIVGIAGYPLESIDFGLPSAFSVDQNEIAWFAGDKWTVSRRLTFDLGLRFDHDSVADSVSAAPRAGFVLALTRDNRTVLKGGTGFFYDRVPLDLPAFRYLPSRSLHMLGSQGEVLSSTQYSNVIPDGLRNPRSEVWNIEVDRELRNDLLIRAGYLQRNTVQEYFLNPISSGPTGDLSLSDHGSDRYKELQISGRYQFHDSVLNASFVHSHAFGDLNDFNQFFGNDPQAVIQPNQRGHLAFDAPNRVLASGEIAVPWKLTLAPVLDIHSGFPYSQINQYREFVGPRNDLRFPRFVSTDAQIWREIHLPRTDKHARIGFGAFNVFNHPNYRDVQADIDSARYGEYFNGVGRIFHGKFVLEF